MNIFGSSEHNVYSSDFLNARSCLYQSRRRKGSWDEHLNRRRENIFRLHKVKSQDRSAFQKIGPLRDNQERPDSSSFHWTRTVENIPHFNESAILEFLSSDQKNLRLFLITKCGDLKPIEVVIFFKLWKTMENSLNKSVFVWTNL